MANEPAGAPKRLEIKKYPNRRYYDATHSRHLTLDEIRSLIQNGYDIRVIDAKSKADITAQVLTQLILELDTQKVDSLPVPLLVRLIRMNDQLVKDFIDKYFNQALNSFLEYQRQAEENFRRMHGLPSTFPTVSAWTKAVFEPFASAWSGRSTEPPGAPSPAAPTGTSPAQTADLEQIVASLQAEIAALKSRGASKSSGKKRRKGA